MNTRLLFIGAALFGTTALMAQENRFSAGLELGLPMGSFGDVTSFGVGATLGYEIPVGDNLGFIAQAGYISFLGKEVTDLGVTFKYGSWGMIPVQVGGKYYLSDNQEGFYLMALVGIHSSSYTIPGYSYSFGGITTTVPDQTASATNLSFAPGLGYIVGENIDLGLRYQIISSEGGSTSYLGVRAAYMFGGR